MRPLEEILQELKERSLNPNILALVEAELRGAEPKLKSSGSAVAATIAGMASRRDNADLKLKEDESRPSFSRCIRFFNQVYDGKPPSKVDKTIEMLKDEMRPWFKEHGWTLPHSHIIEEAAGRRSSRRKSP